MPQYHQAHQLDVIGIKETSFTNFAMAVNFLNVYNQQSDKQVRILEGIIYLFSTKNKSNPVQPASKMFPDW